MPFTKEQIDELKANLAVARKRELPFGLCIGKAAETTVLVNHKTKDPEALGRQAKKDGETAKIAFGMMTVEGKNLNLSCAGDVPTGMARKTRELLKLVGLKLKVRVLDAAGNALEEDGGDEDEDGAAADPLTEEWGATRTAVEEALLAAEALPPATLDPLRAAWAEAGAAAEAGDLGAGIAKGQEVLTAVEAARLGDADRLRWEAALPTITPLVDEAVATATPVAAKINAVWSFAQTKAAGDPPDYAAAVKSITMLVKLIEDSRKGQAKTTAGPVPADAGAAESRAAFAGDGGGGGGGGGAPATAAPAGDPQPGPNVGMPDPNATPKQKLAQAEAALKAIDTAIADYMALQSGSAERKPAAWVTERSRIDAILAPMRNARQALDDTKIEDALTALATLDATIRAASSAKAEWKKTLDLFRLRLVPLDRHAQGRAVPQVKPKIDAIKAEMAKAVAKADRQDFAGATAALAPLVQRCDEAEVLADGFAHYSTILAQRQAAVETNKAHPTPDKPLEDLQAAMETLLADAQALAAAGTYPEAVRKLDEIPPLFDQYRRMDEQRSQYHWDVNRLTLAFDEIDKLPANVRAPFQAKIDGWKKDMADARIAKTGDYAVSVSKTQFLQSLIVTPTDGEASFLDREIAANTAWQTALAAFEPQLAKFRAHAGLPGIEPFVLEMDKDLAKAKAEAVGSKFSTAAAILTRSQPQWPAQTKIADEHVAYATKRDAVTAQVAALKGNPAAATVLVQAEGLMATAATQALSRDFVGALANVTEAEKRVADAKAAADAQDDLGKLKDGPALDGMAADFDKAMKVFTDMRANVVSKDKGNAFAALIATADAPAQAARDAAARTPPDYGAARTELDRAIAILEDALPKVMAKGPYDAHLAAAKAAVAALDKLNTDRAVQPWVTTVHVRIGEAQALAKTSDFPGAEAKLAEAMAVADEGRVNAGQLPAIKADRATTLKCKTEINAKAGVAALMPKRLARIDKLIADIDARVAAGDFRGAAAAAKEGAALYPPTEEDVLVCGNIIASTKKYQTMLSSVTGPGKEAIAAEVAKATEKFSQHQAMLADESFAAARRMLGDVDTQLEYCNRLLSEQGTYAPSRAAAEKAIKAVADVRNDSVEAELVVIEKKYADAEAMAAAQDFVGGERAMKQIPPQCTPLLAKAKAGKLFDDARKLAEPKLAEAEGHASAQAIRPMLTRLRAKFDTAVKQAESDAAVAKRAMDEILPAAKDALEAAKNSAGFAAKTDAMADAGPNPAAIASAKKLRDQLKAKPEATASKADLDEATAQLAAVDAAGGDQAGAEPAFRAATEALTRAEMGQAQARMLGETVKAARAKIAELKAHPQARYVATETAALATRTDAVLKLAQGGSDPDQATADLETTMQDMATVHALADAQARYITLRDAPDVEPRLEVLEKHAHRYAIKPGIDTIRAKLARAAELSADKKPEEALTLLAEIRALGTSSLVLADMRANKPPKVADIKAIIAGPGGVAELDAMIDTLEPDAQRAVLRVAFEARYGVKLDNFSGVDEKGGTGKIADGKKTGPNIKRFYQLLAELPSQDVVNSASIRKFSVIEGDSGDSAYNAKTKDVVMREGDAVLTGATPLGDEHAVGKVDAGCEPANDDEVTRFSWATSHEVGHSVDDKQGFMDKRAGDVTYGGWTSYGRNVKPIADAVAAHFNYDPAYIADCLMRGEPAVPPVPTGAGAVEPEEWERRRIEVRAWIDTAMFDNSPWDSMAVAQRLRIGDLVYQESYQGSWSSYAFAARSKGISGYQFRAAAEWFAELYAAFHAGKLKPAHPSFGWLSAL